MRLDNTLRAAIKRSIIDDELRRHCPPPGGASGFKGYVKHASHDQLLWETETRDICPYCGSIGRPWFCPATCPQPASQHDPVDVVCDQLRDATDQAPAAIKDQAERLIATMQRLLRRRAR